MSNFQSYNSAPDGEKDFQQVAQNVSTNIQKISQNVSSMTRMVNLLGTDHDNKDVRHQLQKIQQNTHQLVKDTNGSLKVLNNIALPTSHEQRKWKVQRDRLTEEFTTTLNLFQSTQRKALKKENEQVKLTRIAANTGTISIPPPPASDPFRDDIHPNQLIELQDNQDVEFKQKQLLHERENLEQLQEQEEAIRALERDISDVNQIYRDLGKLVHEQGETIDSIEANIERTHVTVRDASSELRKASDYAARIRKKRFFLCLILAVILCVIIGVIWRTS